MNTQFWVVQAFNGISYGALLFLIGGGLSLIFGVMRIVNLSHGAYFLWGGYIALSVIQVTGSWALSLPVAAFAVALIGIAMERLFLRSEGLVFLRTAVIAAGVGVIISLAITARWPHLIGGGWIQFTTLTALASVAAFFLFNRISILPVETDVLRQVLLTVGFAFLFQQAALDIWGGNNMDINPPPAFTRSIVVGGIYLPLYRVFMIVMAIAIGIVLWLVMEKTRMGAAVRATVALSTPARHIPLHVDQRLMDECG